VSTHEGGQSSYPPYNIEKTGEDGYRISIAAAGFSEADLEIEVKENTLNVSAQKPRAEDKRTYLHRGIATRAFERQFHLADHVRAVGASYEDGMLHIELIREVPEALIPRRIQIQSKSPLQVDASPA
jgi:molecular chaperone IbpA